MTSTVARDTAAPEHTRTWGLVPGFAAVAVVALVVGLLVDGGAQPLLALDAGPVVRWGLPVTTVLAELFGAATIGCLGLSAFVVPDRSRTTRRRTLVRWASWAAAGWTAATAVQVVLAFSDIAGTPVGDPSFVAQLLDFAWALELTRVLLISGGLALLVALGAGVARGRAATVWLLVGALLGIGVLALNGHSAGANDHENAVNSMGVHLLAMSVWVGGLLALSLIRPRLGVDLGVSVQRYSRVALWAFAFLGASGILQTFIRIDSVAGFLTPYGALVLTKVAAFAVLGWFGWRQRANIADRLQRDPSDGWAFARLATLELGVMALATGVAVALSRGIPPVSDAPVADRFISLTGYPDPGPMSFADWLFAWRIEWLLLGIALVAMGLYAAGVRTLHRRGDAWPALRTAAWMAGWLVWIYATCGAPGIWGRVLFSTHMVMHMVIAMLVPIFLVVGAPVTLLLRAVPARKDKTWGPRELVLQVVHSRFVQVVSNPVVAAFLFFVSLALFYYSPLFGLALTTHTGHLLMLAHFLLTGYLFAWVLIGVDPGPKRWPPLFLLVVLFATVSFHAFFGVIITGQNTLLAADFFRAIHASWMPDPLADQVMAGEIAWGVGELPTITLAVIVAYQWMKSDAAEQRRIDRQADRDDDAELKAYNEMLAANRARYEEPGPAATNHANTTPRED